MKMQIYDNNSNELDSTKTTKLHKKINNNNETSTALRISLSALPPVRNSASKIINVKRAAGKTDSFFNHSSSRR
jgi:hypothetical protein